MKKSMKMFAGLALAAGFTAPAIAADAIAFDPDGAGGDPVVQNVLSFDWSPGNTLAVGGNAAVQTFIATGTTTILPGGITVISGGVSNTFSVFYQAKLAGLNLVGGNPTSPFTPAGLNNNYEITAVARFDERVTSIVIDSNTNTATVNFAHSTNASEYLEIYFGQGAAFNASDLNGTGFNDGKLILESSILESTFISNFASIQGAPVVLDQANIDNYLGQLSVEGSGTTRFNGAVDAFDSTFFVDVLSTLGFENSTNGNQKLPFEEAEPGANFLVNSDGTALGVIPVAAGVGNQLDPILGIGPINGGVIRQGGGNSIQFQADVNTSFTRIPGVVPEPATAAMGLMALAGLALRGRRNRMA